jgi:rhodanese-related sulfurtransferase
MAKTCDLSFTQRSLFQQGYQRFSPRELRQLEWGLRFTPAVCSLIALYGLVTHQPAVLFAVAALGVWAFFFPAAHPMDWIYNRGVRPLFGAAALPEKPLQRRLACLSAGIMNLLAASCFLAGQPHAAWVIGGLLLVLQAIVITTHFCTLSWVYEGVMRLLGKWHAPLSLARAQALLDHGGVLVDVRSPLEFAEGSLPGAINLPLEELERHLGQFGAWPTLLFCRSGFRSHIAVEKLRARGVRHNVYNLGALGRVAALRLPGRRTWGAVA